MSSRSRRSLHQGVRGRHGQDRFSVKVALGCRYQLGRLASLVRSRSRVNARIFGLLRGTRLLWPLSAVEGKHDARHRKRTGLRSVLHPITTTRLAYADVTTPGFWSDYSARTCGLISVGSGLQHSAWETVYAVKYTGTEGGDTLRSTAKADLERKRALRKVTQNHLRRLRASSPISRVRLQSCFTSPISRHKPSKCSGWDWAVIGRPASIGMTGSEAFLQPGS